MSVACEVRPGPEFLLRKYHFYEDGSFHLQQFFYLDNSCTVPAYALDAWGKLQLSRPSWVVPGGTEAEAELSRVHVVPYTADMADRIAQRVNRSCPGQVMRSWRAYRKYRVLSYTENKTANNIVLEDIVCTGGLHVTVNELQLYVQFLVSRT
ncbi:hypothetical protein IscW_ISCW017500 [Ixodes scapularis]|uniref:APCDD1 domain-containing protein n=1 Tax=Ixodes scapularis TaxID=6945 RepID=B7PBL4_IXOSC|nr:hypothetical protein IscW_ISCW017500 [Ixodes scapularis]|eukprot:XP_002408539.1 hypothetical protein IscW_ISCW017500 [Ixodes scapularis]